MNKLKSIYHYNFYNDLDKPFLKEYLLENNILDDYDFLMDKRNFDDLFLWITTYCEDLTYNYKGLEGWILKFCVLRRKALNGGYFGRPRKDY